MIPVIVSALLLLPNVARAGQVLDEAKRLGRDIERGVDHFGHEAKKGLDSVRRGVDGAIAGEFRPLSRDIPADQAPGDDVEWMAILGDSSVTGAVASPRFRVTVDRAAQMMGDLMIQKRDEKLAARIEDFKDPGRFNILGHPVEPLVRVYYTRAEFDQARGHAGGFALKMGARFSDRFDTEEYAFPYLIGRALNFPATRIVLAAQDGRKIGAMNEQLDRVLEVPNVTTLPGLILASFVANDMCHPDNFEKPIDHFENNFRRDVTEQFNALASRPPHAGGTRFVVVAPLNVTEVLTNQNLLDQRVQFENAENATCRSIHDGSGVHGDVAKKLQTSLIGACRGILSPEGDASARVERLSAMQTIQHRVLREAVDQFNARGIGIRAEFDDFTRGISFETGDAAPDCFHLAPSGHERIAARYLDTHARTR